MDDDNVLAIDSLRNQVNKQNQDVANIKNEFKNVDYELEQQSNEIAHNKQMQTLYDRDKKVLQTSIYDIDNENISLSSELENEKKSRTHLSMTLQNIFKKIESTNEEIKLGMNENARNIQNYKDLLHLHKVSYSNIVNDTDSEKYILAKTLMQNTKI